VLTPSPAARSNGFLVIRNVFTPEEVAAANAAIDAHSAQLRSREAAALRNAKDGTPMSAEGPRKDMGGMLWWDPPHCDVFRQVLAHPRLVPYYTALCGEGFRLDHQPLVIAQSSGSEGFALHGGPISGADGVPAGLFNAELQYRCVGGQLWTTLLAASVQLCDHSAGDGGFAIVRGSHKLNLPVPNDVADGLGGIGALGPGCPGGAVCLFRGGFVLISGAEPLPIFGSRRWPRFAMGGERAPGGRFCPGCAPFPTSFPPLTADVLVPTSYPQTHMLPSPVPSNS
jgi:hypothetical protein